jgi:hypothetical protein
MRCPATATDKDGVITLGKMSTIAKSAPVQLKHFETISLRNQETKLSYWHKPLGNLPQKSGKSSMTKTRVNLGTSKA